MMPILSRLLCALLIGSASLMAHEAVEPVTDQQTMVLADYEGQQIHGWTVYVEKTVKDHARGAQAVDLLRSKLAEVDQLITPKVLAKLKEVPIWLNKDIRQGACYHPNPNWLKQNKRMAEKARCIELQSVDTFVDWSVSQPMMVLHELAHAYHHREYGFKEPRITAAFQAAVKSKSYEKVKHISSKEKRHYALTNEKEYFSECTEAYFGKNDFYPFNRAELKAHDPMGYQMVGAVWEVPAKR